MAKRGQARVLTSLEFRRAERAAMLTYHPLRNRALLSLSFELALRACELRQLRIGDILAPDGELLEEVNLTKTKGDQQRPLFLSNQKLCNVLKEYLNYLFKKNKGKINYNAFLFESQKGGEFNPVSMVRLFRDIYKSANLVNARSHSGRRTFITNKIDEGINIRNIALIVGHRDINTTIRYHEKNITTLKKIVSKSIF